jgi:TM2 domain-containing membrane protein YozV
VAILTYYTSAPALPVPTQMNATLLTFLNWARKSNFEKLEGSKCTTTAFSLLWAYLVLQIVQLVNLFLVNVAALYAEYCRALTPSTITKMLENTFWPLVTTAIAFVAYVIMIAGKIGSAINAQNAIFDYETPAFGATLPEGFFPFQKGALDIATLLFVASFMSVIRGYSRQSRSAFRFATGAALLYICAAWSSIVGAARFYRQNKFYDDDKCHDYFMDDSHKIVFGDPNSDQADTYCETFRLSLGAQCIMFFIMHVQMILCAITFSKNEPRPSISDSAYLQHDNDNPYNRYSDVESRNFHTRGDGNDLKKPLAEHDFMTESNF